MFTIFIIWSLEIDYDYGNCDDDNIMMIIKDHWSWWLSWLWSWWLWWYYDDYQRSLSLKTLQARVRVQIAPQLCQDLWNWSWMNKIMMIMTMTMTMIMMMMTMVIKRDGDVKRKTYLTHFPWSWTHSLKNVKLPHRKDLNQNQQAKVSQEIISEQIQKFRKCLIFHHLRG